MTHKVSAPHTSCRTVHHAQRRGGPKRQRGLKYQASRRSFVLWSWGESNPRPPECDRPRYDHSRERGSWLPPRRVGRARRPRHGVFPPGQRSFTPSAVCPSCLHRFCCQAAVDRPRVPLPVAMTLYRLTRSGGESEIVRIGVSVGAPFLESGQLRSHVTTTAIGVETDQPRGWWPEGRRVQMSGALLSSIRVTKGTAGRRQPRPIVPSGRLRASTTAGLPHIRSCR